MWVVEVNFQLLLVSITIQASLAVLSTCPLSLCVLCTNVLIQWPLVYIVSWFFYQKAAL